MSKVIRKPTDYKLETLTLYAPGVTDPVDLIGNMVELNYYEDIFNNTISGNVVVNDSVGLINFSALNGTEYIHLRLKKSDSTSVNNQLPFIDRYFRIVAISDRRFDLANNNENYKIEFCSEEYILSEQYRISKAYKNAKISDIVSDICKTYLKLGSGDTKNIFIDDTAGVYDFVLPNKKIFETLNWLANYAIPSNYPNGADILFFENRIGYFFNSLQHLFSTDPVINFAYNPKNITDDMLYNMTNILTFEVIKYVDTLHAMNNGTFANRLISIDPIKRQKINTDFNYNEYFPKSKSLNIGTLINGFKNRLGKELYEPPPDDLQAGTLRMVVSNDIKPKVDSPTLGTLPTDFILEKSLPYRVAQLNLVEHTKLKITVPGYSGLYAGMCVNITILSTQQLNTKTSRPLDPYLSGKYLVTAVRHIVSPSSYICIAEVCKDSGILPYSGVNNEDQSWKKLVNGIQNNQNK